jgi:hypothetical protein
MPVSIAYARRIWKRGAQTVASIPTAFTDRFTRLEQAVDAMALEMERVSEGQRFLTKVLSERAPRALAEPVARGTADAGR